ncbi:MAG: hypothetical protein HFJ53_00970 [Clostridia bacterium]|jgi:hypothetical protein|nr:hypothetical protein [Clostridia bacterium]
MEEEKITKKKEIYEKWWIWALLIAISVIVIIIGIVQPKTKETSKDVSTNTVKVSTSDNESQNKINPYEITNNYDGTYKFIINNNTNTIVGAINIDGGNLKAKFSDIDNSFTAPTYKGFCGLNKEDNTIFYISIMNNSYEKIREFKCIKSGKNLLGESLTFTDYKNVDFIYVNDSKDIESTYSEVLKQEKGKKEQPITTNQSNDKKDNIDTQNTANIQQKYQSILDEYSKKLRNKTSSLITEYKNEASKNSSGLDGLATICNNKVSVLAEISNEGVGKMAEVYYKYGNGKYSEYEEWANKLTTIYAKEAEKITNVYINSAT